MLSFARNFKKLVAQYLFLALIFTPTIIAFSVFAFDPSNEFFESFKISMVIGEVVMSVCYWGSRLTRGIIKFVFQRYEVLARDEPALSKTFLLNAFWMLPGVYLGFEVAVYFAPVLNYSLSQPSIGSYKRSFIIGVLCFAVFQIFRLRKEIRDLAERSAREKHELQQRTLQSQIAALTSQMNPHLMFNALNSIASLIATNPKIAETMTVTLSSLYRRVLEASKKEMHPLGTELDLCKAYLDIEAIRFSGRLRYDVSLDPDVDPYALTVPVLCLQPIIENAVKHGIMPKISGGEIRVSIKRTEEYLSIQIEDDGVGMKAQTSPTGSGTAIANCQARLDLVYSGRATFKIEDIHPNGTRVTIDIPGARS